MSTSITAGTAESNTSAILSHLEREGLLGHGQLADGTYTDRDHERARLLQYIVQHPEGVLRTLATHAVVKGRALNDAGFAWNGIEANVLERHKDGQEPAPLQRHDDALDAIAESNRRDYGLDGSDSDYQFVYNYTKDLESAGFVRLSDSPAGTRVSPTLDAVDLISEGISKTGQADAEVIYDREFAQKMLKTVRTGKKRLSEPQKDLLADSIRRYIRRIDDYRLVFDVSLDGWRSSGTERMTKPYKTRWSDGGRQDKAFARLQQSFEFGYETAENAVFTTLTTDPKLFDSLWDMIVSINENFNRLRNYLSSDPSTKRDTRNPGVVGWRPVRDGDVTGRPRENLDYIKVLEFTEAGYPHLHVLFFDVPCRKSDGMPWLIDKKELSSKWKQGEIVDVYPLTYRDDLDELGDFGSTVVHDAAGDVVYTDEAGAETHADDPEASPKTEPVSEGFVCWYNHGNHDHGDDWAEEMTRYHKRDGLINMRGDDDVAQNKTAGAYVGKYISKMYEKLEEATSSLGATADDHEGEAAWYKLALYWATERHFWSISHGIRDEIRLDEPEPDPLPPEVEAAVVDATETSLRAACGSEIDDQEFPDFDLDTRRGRSNLTRAVRGTLAKIDFLGAYHYADMPAENLGRHDLDRDLLQVTYDSPDVMLARVDRPPPAADAFT